MVTACLETCYGTASPFSEGLPAPGPLPALLPVVKSQSQALSFLCASSQGQLLCSAVGATARAPCTRPKSTAVAHACTNPRATQQSHSCWGPSEGNQNSPTHTLWLCAGEEGGESHLRAEGVIPGELPTLVLALPKAPPCEHYNNSPVFKE